MARRACRRGRSTTCSVAPRAGGGRRRDQVGTRERSFKLRGDLTKLVNGKVAGCLDEALLDEDIDGFVGMYLFNAVDDIKNNTEIMGDIFSHPENREIGASILFSKWNK